MTATDTNGGNILKKLSDHSLSWSECSPLIFQRSPYDGQAVAQDKTSTNVITEYLNGPGIDNKIRQKAGNTLYYFAQDHLGSTTALTDSKGALVERQTYDTYGNTAGSTRTRYSYTGRERDSLTGLQYSRARFYDPQLGRFISEDPIGLEGGINPFMYVGNDPVDSRDPQGLWPSQGPFKIHQKILKRVLTGRATPEQLRIMMQEQEDFDKATQDEASAYKHAMRARWETPAAARKKANWFVRYNICNARRLAATGRMPEAMRLLSRAMHTLQDSTSPAHANFAVAWENTTIQFVNHLPHYVTENFDPGPRSVSQTK